VANHGGLEAMSWKNSNFEMRNFILGCRNVSRKCKESNGAFSELRKIAIGIDGIFKISSGAQMGHKICLGKYKSSLTY
jgi:hypothetical protein